MNSTFDLHLSIFIWWCLPKRSHVLPILGLKFRLWIWFFCFFCKINFELCSKHSFKVADHWLLTNIIPFFWIHLKIVAVAACWLIFAKFAFCIFIFFLIHGVFSAVIHTRFRFLVDRFHLYVLDEFNVQYFDQKTLHTTWSVFFSQSVTMLQYCRHYNREQSQLKWLRTDKMNAKYGFKIKNRNYWG